MKRFFQSMVMLLAAGVLGTAASAETTTFNGETITYTGASVSTVNNQLVLKFTQSGSLTLPSQATARILVVGGGGAGGGDCGGGGGAGGLIELNGLSIPSGTHTISVGQGGQPSNTQKQRGNNGSDSTLTIGSTVYRAVGGGAGGLYSYNNNNTRTGSNGGSGGGSVSNSNRGSATQTQQGYGVGNNGGLGNNSNIGGGGGGAGGVGSNYSGNVGGKGGDGIVSDITGEKVVYAAGGGGGDCANRTGGGVGGGAVVDGVTVTNVGGHGGCQYMTTVSGVETTVQQGRGFPGKDGTGSGGGGSGGDNGGGGYGGAGGSGVVVVRLTAIESTEPVCQIGSTTYTSLEAAVSAASAGDTIELLMDLTLTDTTIDKDVTITSASGHTYALTRADSASALDIAANVTFTNITLDGGITWANETISGTATTGSTASRGGPLVTVASNGTLTLGAGATVQNFWGRSEDDDVGTQAAIYNAGTLVLNNGAAIRNCRHEGTTPGVQQGGAIYTTGTVTMNGGTIEDCYSSGKGGAIYAAAGEVALKGGTIQDCAAGEAGGAVYIAENPGVAVPTFTYYRFTFTKTKAGQLLQLSEISLYDASNNRINQRTFSATSATSDSGLQVGEYYAQLPSGGSFGGKGGENAANLFDNNTSTKMCVVDANLDGSNGNRVALSFRLADNAAKAVAYTMTTANDETPGRNPVSWTVEGSADGYHWTTIDSHTDDYTMPGGSNSNNDAYRFQESTRYALSLPQPVAASVLKVSGNPTVVDNALMPVGATAPTAVNNVQPETAELITLAGAFTGKMGVAYPAVDAGIGAAFGVQAGGSGVENFSYDLNENYLGCVQGDTLMWTIDLDEPTLKKFDASTLDCSGAEVTTLPNGDVVLVYSNPAAVGTLSLPKNTHARVLVVGGGGAGGTVGEKTPQGAAGGGGAGGFQELETTLEPGDYTIKVGAGAARVDSIGESWVGANGGLSVLENDLGGYVASAKGGGGGGAPKANGAGVAGGSGGGGSWYGSFLSGGSYTDGYGWYGAKPTNMDIGGGGGGAAKTAADGAGKATGAGGAGRTSDITGTSVTYANGGRGGDRTDASYVPADGAAPGAGGDGAGQPGKGGAGADGIVVIRLYDYFEPVEVPFPAYIQTEYWEDGATYTSFDLTSMPASYQAAMTQSGTYSVACSLSTDGGTTVTNGLGRFSFTLTLNEGYVWEDGTTDPLTFFWRVKEPNVLDNASVEVTKTVSWSDQQNAVISITAHATPERIKRLPNILFLGTLCKSHSLTDTTVQMSLTAAAANAEVVDYYLSTSDGGEVRSGTLNHGDKVTSTIYNGWSRGQHACLDTFYNRLYTILSDPATSNKYDYIIFEFDGTRIAQSYTTTANAHESEVAEFLKPYYANKKVILVVDDCYGSNGSDGASREPWADEYWRPNTYEYSSNNKNLSFVALKGMIGMFMPEDYVASATTWNQLLNIESKVFTPQGGSSDTYYAGRRYNQQFDYAHADDLADYIRDMIKPIDYTVGLEDLIHVDAGLQLDGATGSWTTNELTMGWHELTSDQLTINGDGVDVQIPGLSTEAWIKLDIAVSDSGTFRTSINAEYDTRTGLWRKDPNDGPVKATTKPDGSDDAITAEDKAITAVAWPFKAYHLEAEVMTGEETGDIVANGYQVSEIEVGEGSSPETLFRAAPGYMLDKVEIDGQLIEDLDPLLSNWVFENVQGDHSVKVWYKPYTVVPPLPETQPVVEIYDGENYGPTVTGVNFTDGVPFEWIPVYSLTPDGEFTPDGGQKDVVYDENGKVTSVDVYVRIAVYQPGYDEPIVLDGPDDWMGVNKVTILPREITVTFDDQVQTNSTKITDFTWKLTDGEIVEGDTLNVSGTCVNYPDQTSGGTTTDSIHTDATHTISVTTPGVTGPGNYIIHEVPGDYTYMTAASRSVNADGTGETKVYDGEPSSIEVNAVAGENARITKIEYKDPRTGEWSETNPEFTDAGTYEVQWRVSWQNKNTNDNNWTDQTQITGSDTVTITPRPVTVTAGSATKTYDGQPLTEDSFTVSETTLNTGFVAGEGLADVTMTGASTQTAIGSTSNVIDPSKNEPLAGTNLSNYDITYVPGTLTVLGKINTTPTPVEKYYDGTPSGIVVETDIPEGVPYTIRYTTDPSDPNSWTDENPTFTDVGVGHVVTYVVEAEGYEPVTNSTYVTIWPREVLVTADDLEKIYGTPDPELTWSLGPNPNAPEGVPTGAVSGEEETLRALIAGDDSFSIVRDKANTAEGEKVTPEGTDGYPITPSGDAYIGNYHVTYVPGELRIVPAIFSSNIYGLLKINSTFANTIIPAPWKGYTQKGSPELDIRVDRLVKPRNLTEGDKLLFMAGDGTYKTWVLEKNETTGEGQWTGLVTVKAASQPDPDDVIRSLTVAPAGDETLKRGYGLWLIRQNPVTVTNGGATTNAVPFYLHGQWMTGVEEIEVFGTDSSTQGIKYDGAVYDKAAYTMLADPDCLRPSVINNHTWTGWSGDDTLIVNTDEITTYFCLHLPKRGGGYQEGWRYWTSSGYQTDAQTTPGIGFWYVRRAAGNLSLKWDGEPQYKGEAEPHSVWIVDHADAGNGKVHLAFKLESPIAPAKMTTTFIQELFASRSIRYMHATGATQAAGKLAMDGLDPEKESDVKLVPALRNGTGVATDDPATDPDLAKGWIWVTIDVPDGSTVADPAKDGTGDTNGAGDLWRIVIGRGMWE